MTILQDATVGLSALADRYGAVLCDVWGVVHNGRAAHESAVDALVRYRAQGGRVVFITNAPRPAAPIIAMLDELAVPKTAYDGLISSGDATRGLFQDYAGKAVHHVGPADDRVLFEGLDLALVAPQDADVVVVTDLDSNDETPGDYADRLELWRRRDLPLICANPDKVVEEGDRLMYCGGALADAYEAMGGRVMMAGKPFDPIYAQAKQMLETAAGRSVAQEEILAIGDSVRTDAVGAARFGIDFLFVTGSIHAAELDAFNAPDSRRIVDFVAESRANMVGFMPRLAW